LLKAPAMELQVAPDGRAVAYSYGVSHFSMNVHLLPLTASGSSLPRVAGAPRQLTNGRGLWHVHNGGWSPDGKTIVYTRDTDQGDIYVIENFR
jgi:Tol biopolymer transport system component